jgi:Pectate lyase superfamily protein
MRTLLYSLLICFIPMESPAQILVRDIKKDFGAKGDGRTNDHEAFRRAARFINARKGNVRLLIPAGTYIVGKVLDKPMHLRNNFWYDENFDVPDSIDLFRLKNCTNVSIIGSNGARLKVQDRVKFGSFDPNTGAIPHAGSPPPPYPSHAYGRV